MMNDDNEQCCAHVPVGRSPLRLICHLEDYDKIRFRDATVKHGVGILRSEKEAGL
jgi:hypothetical protein